MAGLNFISSDVLAHTLPITSVSISQKSCALFATGSEDCKVNVWGVDKLSNPKNLSINKISSLISNKYPIKSLCFDSNELYVVSGSLSGSIKVFDIQEGKLARNIGGHQTHVSTLQYHPYGEFIASGSIDCSVKMWDVRSKTCIQTYNNHEKEITCVKFSPDGRWVASSGKDGNIIIYDLVAGKLQNTLKLGPNYPTTFEFNPTEFVLAAATSGRNVKLYDLDSMELISMTPSESSLPKSIAFSNDGNILTTCTKDYLRTWQWDPTMKSLWNGDVIYDKVQEIRISSSNHLIGLSINSGTVTCWDLNITEPWRSPPSTQINNISHNVSTISTSVSATNSGRQNNPLSKLPINSNSNVNGNSNNLGLNNSTLDPVLNIPSGNNKRDIRPTRIRDTTSSNNGAKDPSLRDNIQDISYSPFDRYQQNQTSPRYANIIPDRHHPPLLLSPDPSVSSLDINPESKYNRNKVEITSETNDRKGAVAKISNRGHWGDENASRELASSMSESLWKQFKADQILLQQSEIEECKELQSNRNNQDLDDFPIQPAPKNYEDLNKNESRTTPPSSRRRRQIPSDLKSSELREHNQNIKVEIVVKTRDTINSELLLPTSSKHNAIVDSNATISRLTRCPESIPNLQLSGQDSIEKFTNKTINSGSDSKPASADSTITSRRIIANPRRHSDVLDVALNNPSTANRNLNNVASSVNTTKSDLTIDNSNRGLVYQSNLVIPNFPSFAGIKENDKDMKKLYPDLSNHLQSDLSEVDSLELYNYIQPPHKKNIREKNIYEAFVESNNRLFNNSDLTKFPINQSQSQQYANENPNVSNGIDNNVLNSYRSHDLVMRNTRENNLQIIDKILERIDSSHVSLLATLKNRLVNTKMLRKMWVKFDISELMDYLNVIYEGSKLDVSQMIILSDFFISVNFRKISLTLSHCLFLSQILDGMLHEKSEYFIQASIIAYTQILQPFAQLIYETRGMYTPGSVDISKEERLSKCNSCFTILCRTRKRIETVKKLFKKDSRISQYILQLTPLVDLAIS
jgi:WD40 repeat protein